tara:strand:+ start:1141 stop:1446 length:306 start_codon:yes stop_codon:yes gene_type:complete
MNMISQLRQRVSEDGAASLNIDEFNRLQTEWVTRAKIEVLPPVARECAWGMDDGDPDSGSMWNSACGQSWFFYEGGPEENNQHYCGNCGGKVLLPAQDPTL